MTEKKKNDKHQYIYSMIKLTTVESLLIIRQKSRIKNAGKPDTTIIQILNAYLSFHIHNNFHKFLSR